MKPVLRSSSLFLFLALLILPKFSFADGGGKVGGGKVQESDLRYFIGMMDPYLQSEEGKKTFPEIVAYDASHSPEDSFHNLINRIHPVVKPGPVRDAFQDDRDCVANFNDPNHLFFTCNSSALPEMKLENHPSLYRIVLHELFVAAGIEKPISAVIPSDYSVSYRITTHVHLEVTRAWVPGGAPVADCDNDSIAIVSSGSHLSLPVNQLIKPDQSSIFIGSKIIENPHGGLYSHAMTCTLEFESAKYARTMSGVLEIEIEPIVTEGNRGRMCRGGTGKSMFGENMEGYWPPRHQVYPQSTLCQGDYSFSPAWSPTGNGGSITPGYNTATLGTEKVYVRVRCEDKVDMRWTNENEVVEAIDPTIGDLRKIFTDAHGVFTCAKPRAF